MLRTMAAAYEIGQLRGHAAAPGRSCCGWPPQAPPQALHLDGVIGNLAPGMEADLVVLDLASTPAIAQRAARADRPLGGAVSHDHDGRRPRGGRGLDRRRAVPPEQPGVPSTMTQISPVGTGPGQTRSPCCAACSCGGPRTFPSSRMTWSSVTLPLGDVLGDKALAVSAVRDPVANGRAVAAGVLKKPARAMSRACARAAASSRSE